MSTLVGPGTRDPGVWAFSVEDLAVHGVDFDEAQRELYRRTQYQPTRALAVGFPNDPQSGAFQAPLFTMDDAGADGVVVIPQVVNLSPAYADEVLQNQRYVDCFPWLAGRLLIPAGAREWEFQPAAKLGTPEGFRLWSLWPITEVQVEDVLDGTRLWLDENYHLLEAYYACERGDMDPCDIVVENEGIPYDDHQHREHLNSTTGEVIVIECADGEKWMEQFKRGHFRLDHQGLLVPKPMPDLKLCDPGLQQTWEHLRDISALSAYRAITAIPPADREAVLLTERHYSPWLWSLLLQQEPS